MKLLANYETRTLEHCLSWKVMKILPHLLWAFYCWFQEDYEKIPNGRKPYFPYPWRLIVVATIMLMLSVSISRLTCFFCCYPLLPAHSRAEWLDLVPTPLETLTPDSNGKPEKEQLDEYRLRVMNSPAGWIRTAFEGDTSHTSAVFFLSRDWNSLGHRVDSANRGVVTRRSCGSAACPRRPNR